MIKKDTMITGLIFDVDGTLWDPTDSVAVAYNRAIREESSLSLRVTGDDLRKQFGRPIPEIGENIFYMLPADERRQLLNECLIREPGVLRELRPGPYPGTAGVIRSLSKKYPLYIVSNCQAGYVEDFLEICGLENYFSGHLCPDDTGMEKAGNIRLIMEKKRFDRTFYIGDLPLDRQASEEAGAEFIFAAYGFGEITDAVLRIDAITGLPGLLEKLDRTAGGLVF